MASPTTELRITPLTTRLLGMAALVLTVAACNGKPPAPDTAASSLPATAAADAAGAAAATMPGTPGTPADASSSATAHSDQPAQDVPPATAQSSGALSPAKWSGYAATTFGMTPAQASDALGSALDGAPGKGSTCFQVTPAEPAGADGVRLMFEDGKLVRYDVRSAAAIAPGGGQVGQDLPALVTRYGSGIVQQPHKYVEGASNLRIPAPDGRSVLVLETDASQRVVAWRVGVPPQVDYVEGCG